MKNSKNFVLIAIIFLGRIKYEFIESIKEYKVHNEKEKKDKEIIIKSLMISSMGGKIKE